MKNKLFAVLFPLLLMACVFLLIKACREEEKPALGPMPSTVTADTSLGDSIAITTSALIINGDTAHYVYDSIIQK